MKRIGLRCAALAFMLSGAGGAPTIDATYIGNEGFLFEGGGKKVLIDSLFENAQPFLSPSPDLLNRMVAGQQPFGGVDLVLLTHGDYDHFNAPLTVAFLKNNKGAQLVAHASVVARLREQADFAVIGGQVHEVECAAPERKALSLKDVKLEILCLDHAHPADKPAQKVSLAYVVELGGGRLLHMGDATAEQNAAFLEAYPFGEKTVDALFLLRFDVSPATQRLVAERIKPGSIVVMHIAPGDFDEAAARLKPVWANAVLPAQPMERHSFQAR